MSVYEFADFRLDPQERTFFLRDQSIQLAPKVFDTLVALVARHGRLVSKETLMEEIWNDCFVEENNLTQYIFTLRRVLGEKKDGVRFIETVPRKGYRFTAEVRVIDFPGFPDELPGAEAIRLAPAPLHAASPDNYFEKIDPADYRFGKNRVKRFSAYGLIVLLITAAFGVGLRYEAGKSLSFNSKNLKIKRLTESGNLFGAAISPDGSLLAYVAVEGKNHSVRLRNIQTESEVTIAEPRESVIMSPRFSPDGNFVYFSQSGRDDPSAVYQIPVLGGATRRIAENIFSEFAISPDGREIAFPRKDLAAKKHYIVVAETDGSGERNVAERSDPDYYALWGPAPVWSPDGSHLTVVTGQFGEKVQFLTEVDLADGSERELKTQEEWAYIDSVGWTGKDELIIAAQKKGDEKTQLWRIAFPEGASERLTNDFSAYEKFNLNRDASKLVVLKYVENLHLWHYDSQTNLARKLTFGEDRADGSLGVAIAPDGNIIFSARNKNEYELFSIDPETGETLQLTKTGGRNTFPTVSPDNQRIVFTSERTGSARLWMIDRDGSNPRQLTPPSDDKQLAEFTPRFSADGKWVFYSVFRNSLNSNHKISSEGGEPIRIDSPDKGTFDPVGSPDGKLVAFGVFDASAKQPWLVGVKSLDDGSERTFNFPAFRFRTRWMPDSESLVSIEQSFSGANLWQTNIRTGERHQITNFNAERIFNFDVSADGKTFVVSRGNGFYDAVLIEK